MIRVPDRESTIRTRLAAVLAFAAIAVFFGVASPAQTVHASQSRFSLSSGCGKQPASTGQSRVVSKDGRDIIRTYLLLVPKDYDPHKTYSLIFVFHGAGGTAEASMAWGLQNVPGAAEAGIFVFPQGAPYRKGEVGWDDSTDGYDMRFFDNMVSEIESGYCIDRDEVFVAGFSWGGDFAKSLGCIRGDTVQAMAVNSAGAGFTDKSDFRTFVYLPCPGRQHPAVRFVHAVDGDQAYAAPEFATTSQLYQFLDQCGGASRPAPSNTEAVSCRVFDGCAKQYVECTFGANIGHALPPNWAQDTWEFFAGFRKSDRDASHYR
jgi:poly(3-hydroxybutyrate) depolymerase